MTPPSADVDGLPPRVRKRLAAFEAARRAAVEPAEQTRLAVRAAVSLIVELARAEANLSEAERRGPGHRAPEPPGSRAAIRRLRRATRHEPDS